MTNAAFTEKSYERWRREIRTFCDEIREQLGDLRENLADEPCETATPPDAHEGLDEYSPVVPPAPEATTRSSNDDRVSADPEEFRLEANETSQRLQTLKRQLESLLVETENPSEHDTDD